MEKKHIIIIVAIILIILIGFLVFNKLNEGDDEVRFKVLESSEAPEKIKDILPKYLAEEKALTCKLNDEIYIVVTRGEKKTGGYGVDVDKIIRQERDAGEFDITVVAKYNDPSPDELVTQGFDYPFVIVKTNLDTMPKSINLEVEYEEE